MVDVAVCEMDTEKAPCRALKLQLVKVMVEKDEFVELQDYDDIVTLEDAKKVMGDDYEAFMKRNRFNDKNILFLVQRLKNADDIEALKPYFQKKHNGWVDLTKLDEETKAKVMEKCSKTNRINAWDSIGFDELNETCAKCPLAWNKGRDCIGTFGPETSALPAIAEKYGCPVIASAVTSVAEKKKFTAEDAKELLRETEVLAPVLINEGKMAAHRYSGPVERLNSLAKACVECQCGFYFF